MAAEAGRRWSIRRAAVGVTLLTGLSTLLGLARDIVIAAVFGAGPELDAYLVAQGLMNIVLGLIAGAMARSVTPVAAREAAGEGDRRGDCPGHHGIDVAITVTMIVLGLAGLVMGLLAGPVTTVLAPGFGPDQAALTEQLTRIVLIATVLISGTNLLAGLAHGHGRFRWAAAQGIPFNLIMIVAATVAGPQFGVLALAVGFVVGSAARLLLQLIPLAELGLRIRPSLDLRDPGFRQITTMVPPLLLGSAVGNVNVLVDRAVASTLDEGSITALSYGWRLISLPETILIASLLVPLYPALGAAAADLGERRRLVGRGLAVAVTVLTPLVICLAVAAPWLVGMVFGHGAFDAVAVEKSATAVLWYAPALLALGVRSVLLRAAHAFGDARGPVLVSIIAMVINVVGDLTLGPLFGIPGLAFSTTVSLVLAALINGWLLARRHHAVAAATTVPLLLRALGLGVAATAAGLAVRFGLAGFGLPDFALAAAIGIAVCGTYLAGLFLLRAPERLLLGELLPRRRR
ncbi:murein biosynthesis integral membrane protein MurJ [Microlunatus speluncae]|uniref:murein biosynthesis integral membrane protein MurJ n=1 Tax=Microlunatus speluncae TaxID=2594267 RepID=UPI00126623BC|nr:murein biosynthesis integral membrane protein MurJ [Microlunatus speluncae]